MKIMVAGGAGFIGSHLCKFLLEQTGNEVICLDSFFTGNRGNLREIIRHPNFTVIPHDITDTKIQVDLKVPGGVDQIYNLACPASPVHYQFDPIETIKASTIGVINLLEFARLNGARILQTSTSEVYGDPLEHPQKESYRGNVTTLGPRACYDEGKRVAETLFIDYHRKYNLPIRIARIFNTYGTYMDEDDGRVVSNFVMQALQEKPLTVYGKGEQTRSFCYVEDTVKALFLLMESKEIGPVNVGNPHESTVKQLAEKILQLTKSNSKIVYEPLPVDDPVRRNPDISKAREKLNWEPRVELEEGLKKTIEYFKNLS